MTDTTPTLVSYKQCFTCKRCLGVSDDRLLQIDIVLSRRPWRFITLLFHGGCLEQISEIIKVKACGVISREAWNRAAGKRWAIGDTIFSHGYFGDVAVRYKHRGFVPLASQLMDGNIPFATIKEIDRIEKKHRALALAAGDCKHE